MSKNVIPDEENFLTNFEPVGKTPSSEAQLKVVEQQGREDLPKRGAQAGRGFVDEDAAHAEAGEEH